MKRTGIQRTGLLLGIIALFIVVFYGLGFYPGYMSYDSAYHYEQLESGEWTTFQPVIILLFWQITDVIIKGPGGLFLLFLVIYLLSLWLMARYVQGGWQRRVLLMLTALFPLNLMIFPHIWKDIGLLVFTLLSIGFLMAFLQLRKRGIMTVSFIALFIAVLFRFEAILYLWPLVVYQVFQYRINQNDEQSVLRKPRYQWRDVVWVGIFVVVGLVGNKALVEISGAKKITLWPTVALWDIARVSVREGEVLMPSFTVGVGMTVDDLHQATHNWTNTSLFSSTKAGVNNGLYTPYTLEQYDALMKVWVTLPFKYPVSYAKHRLRLGSDLLRIIESDNKPQDLFWTNRVIGYDERFPVNQSELNQAINHFLSTRKDDIYFKPWFYMVLAIIMLMILWRMRPLNPQQQLAMHLLFSALLSIAVMLLLAPAAEQRYLIILFNFVPIAGLLAWEPVKIKV